jgi:nitrite reductase/ring-hydroxylating ferredoxin subunit
MLYRRVRSKCKGEQYRLTTGQCSNPEDIPITGTGDFYYNTTGQNLTNPVNVIAVTNATGLFPNSDLRAL